ncbi:TRAP transporter small permease [Maritalea sp.]|uniref:TRAP transporter small permease n=1 Tax=Maritalea sp. TaxID=2003361 RepID=UPI003EFA0903
MNISTYGTSVTQFSEKLIQWWAMLGGIALFGVVAVNGVSVVGGMFGTPFPGDFELTEIGVAIAVFAFLPYCQLQGANVSADIFTSKAKPRTILIFKLLGSIVALIFACILLWRMSYGLMDQLNYGYTTSILRVPHWMAFVPILVSLLLLAIASLITSAHHIFQLLTGGQND